MIHNCIRCKSKLIPIVYGKLNPEMIEMQNKGLLLIGMKGSDKPRSFCPLCEEAYADYTDIPTF